MKRPFDDWVHVAGPVPTEPGNDEREDMLRIVTAVSEVQAILGNDIELGRVSAAVRQCNCDVSKAVDLLLRDVAASTPSPNVVSPPKPSAPPKDKDDVVFVAQQEERIKCTFCEVANSATNRNCFVCGTVLARPAGNGGGVNGTPKGTPVKNNSNNPNSNNNNSNNNNGNANNNRNGNNNNAGGSLAATEEDSVDSMVIPADMYGDVDLTRSTELAIKQMLWEEQQAKKRDAQREEELTKRYLDEERRKAQQELDKKRYECNICLNDCKIEEMYILEECYHRFCRECLCDHCKSNINDGNTREIPCPFNGCVHKMSYSEVRQVVDPVTMAKFEDFLLKATLQADANVAWCPKPNCGIAMIAEGGLMMICPNPKCHFTFCRNCKVEWHADATCEQFRQWQEENNDAENRFKKWTEKNTKPCPKCKTPIEKNGGCNHMTCRNPNCNFQFCWLCLKVYSSDHFQKKNGCKQFT